MWINSTVTLIVDGSIVVSMDYSEMSFLFTDVIRMAANEPMLDLDLDPEMDGLQLAHHGADSVTTTVLQNLSTLEVTMTPCGQCYGIPWCLNQ